MSSLEFFASDVIACLRQACSRFPVSGFEDSVKDLAESVGGMFFLSDIIAKAAGSAGRWRMVDQSGRHPAQQVGHAQILDLFSRLDKAKLHEREKFLWFCFHSIEIYIC